MNDAAAVSFVESVGNFGADFESCSMGSAPLARRCARLSPSMHSMTRKSMPSCEPISKRLQMLGWLRAETGLASRSKRSLLAESVERWEGRILMAMERSRRVSRAR